ncbi:MAG: cold-shock protein [Chloroflexota bacterium]
MATGTIKKLVRDRGFGFIRDEGGEEYFFHRTAVEADRYDDLVEGQNVEYEVQSDPRGRGMRAMNVRSAS